MAEIKPEVAVDETQDKAIEIDLDKPNGQTNPPVSSEPKYVTVDDLEKIRKQLNGLSYLGRQFQEVSRKIDTLQSQPQPRVQADGSKDPYDELVEKDWKMAVRQLAREEAETLRKAQLQQDYARSMEQNKINLLEESKKKVIERYPEIQDPNSEVSKIYINILSKNQDYLQNERGPLLAMRDMEEELRSEGRLDEISKKAVEKEVSRQVRAGATSLPRASSGNASPNKISLSRDQKEFCDHNNIRYEDYARNLRQIQNSREGVEA